MNRLIRLILTIIIIAGLLLISLASISFAGVTNTDPSSSNPELMQASSDGGYQIEFADWNIGGKLIGPGYLLEVTSSPSGSGTPCCCTYLPCMQKH